MKSIFINVFATVGVALATCVIILIIAASVPPAEEASGLAVPSVPGQVVQPKPKAGPWNSLVSAFRKRLMATANDEAAKQASKAAQPTPAAPNSAPSDDPKSKPEDSFTDYSPSIATTHISSAADRSKVGGSRNNSGSDSASTQKIRGFFGGSGGGSGGGSSGGGGGGGGGGLVGNGESYADKLAKSLGESLSPQEMDELIANQQNRAQEE